MLIQLLYSRKSEKVQARTCTRSIKDKKYPSEGKLTEPHFITVIQRLLKLKVELAGVVRAVHKHTTKILHCVVSFPGCKKTTCWVNKASRAQHKKKERK